MVRIVEAIAETLRREVHRGMGGNAVSPFPVDLEPPFTQFRHADPNPKKRGMLVEPYPLTEAEVIPLSDLRFLKVRLSSQDSQPRYST